MIDLTFTGRGNGRAWEQGWERRDNCRSLAHLNECLTRLRKFVRLCCCLFNDAIWFFAFAKTVVAEQENLIFSRNCNVEGLSSLRGLTIPSDFHWNLNSYSVLRWVKRE